MPPQENYSTGKVGIKGNLYTYREDNYACIASHKRGLPQNRKASAHLGSSPNSKEIGGQEANRKSPVSK